MGGQPMAGLYLSSWGCLGLGLKVSWHLLLPAQLSALSAAVASAPKPLLLIYNPLRCELFHKSMCFILGTVSFAFLNAFFFFFFPQTESVAI